MTKFFYLPSDMVLLHNKTIVKALSDRATTSENVKMKGRSSSFILHN